MIRCHVDRPAADTLCDPLGFSVEGWLHAGEKHGEIERIEVITEGRPIGHTFALGVRDDVSAALQLPPDTRTGFQIFCHDQTRPPRSVLSVTVRVYFRGDAAGVLLATTSIKLVPFDYRTADYGHALDANFTPVMHREQVYGSGPSLAEGSLTCLALVEKYLGPPPLRVLDVGCGLGFYGKKLRAAGYDWTGAEMKTADCAELTRQNLPHRQVDGRTLPFADGAFDAAMCIEVMEHVEDLDAFLTEIRRVAPRLVVSVPNFEPVAYLGKFSVVPWHLLEADHKNFFTRHSLGHLLGRFFSRVEVTCYHELPLPSREGTPLFNSLFASASA
jgi:SAM-dependent methyltransferase